MELTVAETVFGTLQRRSRFDFKSWWTKWHWDRFFSQYFSIVLSVPFHQCCTFIFIHILLLPEKTREWNLRHFKEMELSDTGKHLRQKASTLIFLWSTKSHRFPVLHTASAQFHHLPLLPKDLPRLQHTFTRTGAYWEHAKQYILSPFCNKHSASRDILLLLLLILRLLQYSFYLVVRKAATCSPEAVLWLAISIRYLWVVLCRQASTRVVPGFPNDTARFTCKPSHLNIST